MIYTSYFGNIKNLPSDCEPISISRWVPKWYKGQTLLLLAPSTTLLKWWINSKKTKRDEEIYIKNFDVQLAKLNPKEIEQILIKKCGDKIPTLICYEGCDEFCHRHLVSEWFNNNGIKCKEIY